MLIFTKLIFNEKLYLRSPLSITAVSSCVCCGAVITKIESDDLKGWLADIVKDTLDFYFNRMHCDNDGDGNDLKIVIEYNTSRAIVRPKGNF
jgi:hypothetical protein